MSTKPTLQPEQKPIPPQQKWWKRRKLHKKFGYLVLGLIVIVIVHGIFIDLYDFWDVGSNSWFARFWGKTAQFQLQRGAAVVQHDQFGDQFSSIRYLDQGWTPAESMWFYTTNQGSDLLPYDFFMALEKPGATELFRSDDNLNRYRYLPQNPTVSNPDALPVGFVKDKYKGKHFLGFTCAACHTGQLNYNGIGIRVDGAPAGTDMDSMLNDLKDAVVNTSSNADVKQRFVKRVLDIGNYSSEKDVVADLEQASRNLSLYTMINHSPVPYGYSRLDAFGRIYNRVLEHVLTRDELEFTLKDLVKKGRITQADLDLVLNGKGDNVLSGKHRDHLIARLAEVLPLRAQVALKNELFNVPDAPVSYPFLWDIPQHDYVQWNGVVANAGLGPLGRNTGEVIGTFATLDWEERPGISFWSLISGQGFHTTHISFDSSVNVHNLRRIENQLWRLQSPKWPEEILGTIQEDSRKRGELLFKQNCVSCHEEVDRTDEDRRVVAHMTALKYVGTDPKMAANGVNYTGLSGILKNYYTSSGGGQVLINKTAPVVDLVGKATFNVIATPRPDKGYATRALDWVDDLAGAYFSNEIKPSIKRGTYNPDTTAEPYASLLSYKARSLNGIWATAPYLHNGSVPTLYDLLLPKKGPNDPESGEYRPDKFEVGSREFDPKKVGLKSSGYDGFLFDASRRGNSNAGHLYGAKVLSTQDRWDLVEYLKSL